MFLRALKYFSTFLAPGASIWLFLLLILMCLLSSLSSYFHFHSAHFYPWCLSFFLMIIAIHILLIIFSCIILDSKLEEICNRYSIFPSFFHSESFPPLYINTHHQCWLTCGLLNTRATAFSRKLTFQAEGAYNKS